MQRSCGENVSGTNAARRLLCLEKSERGGGQRRNTASDPIRAAAPVRTGAHEARSTVWRPKVPRSARLEMKMAMTTAMWHDGVTRTPRQQHPGEGRHTLTFPSCSEHFQINTSNLHFEPTLRKLLCKHRVFPAISNLYHVPDTIITKRSPGGTH